jgi:O-antigen/teichoic acid export membrane protein
VRPGRPDQGRVAAVVVLFQPDAAASRNLSVLAREFDGLFPVDNSSRNRGVGWGLNAGVEAAAASGHTHVVLLDQDTRVPAGYARRMMAFRAGLGPGPAIVAPDYRDPATGIAARHALAGAPLRHAVCTPSSPGLDVAWAITAGSLLDVDLFRRLGPFRDDFFIDHVDTEYCLRARAAGARIVVNCQERIDQPIGRQQLVRLGPWQLRPSNHPPARRYTMARNGVRTARMYGARFPELRAHFRRWWVRDAVKTLLFERGRAAKLGAMTAGWWHGVQGRGGPAPARFTARETSVHETGGAPRGGLLSGTSVTLAALVAPLLAALALIPFLIGGLGAARFGVLALVWALIGYLGLFDLGIGRALTHVLSRHQVTPGDPDRGTAVWTALALVAVIGLAGAALLAAAAPVVVGLLQVPATMRQEVVATLRVAALAIPFATTATALRGVLEADRRFATAALLRAPIGLSMVLAPAATLLVWPGLVPAVAAIVAFRAAALGAHAAVVLRGSSGWSRARLDRGVTRTLLGYGGWVSVNMAVGPLMLTMDRFVIGALISTVAVAHYATPFEVVSRIWLPAAALTTVLFPVLSGAARAEPAHAAALVRRSSAWLGLALVPVGALGVVFAWDLMALWVGPAFADESWRAAQLLLAGAVVLGLQAPLHVLLQAAGRPDIPAKLNLMELPVYAAAVVFLTLELGIAGCALAMLLRAVVDTLLLMYFADRELGGSLLRRRPGGRAAPAEPADSALERGTVGR